MSIEELKELYISKSENIDWETQVWCKSLMNNKPDGNFGPIGANVLCDLIKLLGNTENYDKFSIEQIENLIDNEQEIKELLKNTNETDYSKLKELFNANDFVKEKTYECIKENLLELKLKQWRESLKDNAKEGIIYRELNRYSFLTDKDGNYVAKNVLFNNLKVDKVEILGDIDIGLNTIENIIEKYKNTDLKKLCVEMLVNGDFSDWDENTTTFEKCNNLLTDEIQLINVIDNEMEMWFNTTDADAFGGHNPVLSLYTEKERKSIGIQ